MNKETVFKNAKATMVYYPNEKIIHNTFKGRPTGKEFRDALNAGVEVMKKRGGSKWLSDDREHQVDFTSDEQVWADTDWFPRMVEAGWKTWAMVVPTAVKDRMNVKEIIDKIYDQGIRVAVFTDVDEALDWLKKA